MTSLKWKNILISLCAQRMKPNPSLIAAITPYGKDARTSSTIRINQEQIYVRICKVSAMDSVGIACVAEAIHNICTCI